MKTRTSVRVSCISGIQSKILNSNEGHLICFSSLLFLPSTEQKSNETYAFCLLSLPLHH